MKKGILIVLLVLCLLILGLLILNLANGGIWIIEGLNGKDGVDGQNGTNGQDGKDGKDGKSAYELAREAGFSGSLHEWLLSLAVQGMDGAPGKNGVGVRSAAVDANGHLIVTLTDGTVLDAGQVRGDDVPAFSDQPDADGFYEVYETVVMTGYSSLNLRLEPDITNGEVYTAISYGTVLLRIGDQKVEDGYSRFLYKNTVCYARSHNFEMQYNYNASVPVYHLPERFVMTAGEQSLFHVDQIMPNKPDDIKVSFSYTGAGERAYLGADCFAVTPSSAGEGTLTVRFSRYENGELTAIASERVPVTVVAKTTHAAALTGLFLGDSRISGGDLLYAMKSAMPNLTFLGTRPLSASGIYHEGRGAWSTEHYLSEASSDVSGVNTANAFYNPATNGFDFTYYMQENGFAGQTLDFVVINLGANDAFSRKAAENIAAMVASIHAYSAEIKVLILHEYLSPADGYCLTGSANRDVEAMRVKQFGFFSYLSEQFAEREDEGIYLLPTHLGINAGSDWPREEIVVGDASSLKVTDVVHLGSSGYGKEADVIASYLGHLFG